MSWKCVLCQQTSTPELMVVPINHQGDGVCDECGRTTKIGKAVHKEAKHALATGQPWPPQVQQSVGPRTAVRSFRVLRDASREVSICHGIGGCAGRVKAVDQVSDLGKRQASGLELTGVGA